MRKILVPIDFSFDSLHAIEKAIFIAQKVEGEIDLIHINKVKTFAGIFNLSKANLPDEDVERGFSDLFNHLDAKGVKINKVMKKGSVAKEIIHYAEESGAYMIVIGTHGASGFEESWMGSNAYRVVSGAPCPILSTRGDTSRLDIKKIVLPIDTAVTTRQKVPFTRELAKLFDAEIHVVATCVDETEEFVLKLTSYVAQVCRHLNQHNVKNTSDFLTGSNIATMTIEYAKKVDADLISIMTDQESGVFSLSDYAQQFVNRSPIPILSMHKNTDLEGDVHIM